MRKIQLFALAPLMAAFLVPMTGTAHAVTVPDECAVPPDIDLTQFNVIIGSDESEVLQGTTGPDFICGLLGDDVIFGYGGDDLILSDTTTFFGNFNAPGGNDVVDAGKGADQVLPGPGDDIVNGGPGADFLALAVGNDYGAGGLGDDVVQGGTGTDHLLGGLRDDVLIGGPGNDEVNGGLGNDFLVGELPPPEDGQQPPPFPDPPSVSDLCIGSRGMDSAFDCDIYRGVEDIQTAP